MINFGGMSFRLRKRGTIKEEEEEEEQEEEEEPGEEDLTMAQT